KEGFLRAERSLIQTIGRAARNLHGKAILYADRITDSMRKAIDETERRRAKQIAYNAAHGIEPQAIVKRVKDLIDGVYSDKRTQQDKEVALASAQQQALPLSEAELAKEIKRVEKDMLDCARRLEFEAAARLRDRLALLKQQLLGVA
ncbi:TPA: UvrB/UvrC motif-containing protein, partial [Vibrio cholerae O1]